MTFLATIHAKEYALIAADKMEVAKIGSGFVCVSTDVDKIIDTEIGLMTGSGYTALLDEVKSAVSESEIKHTDQILAIIKDRRLKILRNSCLPENQKSDFLDNTGWLFTYFTVVDAKPTIRVAIYSPHVSDQYLGIVEESKCSAFFPSDSTATIRESFMASLKNEMVTSDGAGSFQDTLSINSRLILRLMKEMSRISSFVTESCDIGLVLLDGTTLIARNVNIQTERISFVAMTS
jgi:hypothetical protein